MLATGGALYQDGPMYCPHCGTPTETSPCKVCGTAFNSVSPLNPLASIMAEESGALSMYAGWWRRVGATVVDNLILFIPTLLVDAVFSSFGGWFLGALAGVAVQGLYMVTMLSAPRGQTYGNRVALSVVRDAATQQTITRAQSLKRWGFIAVYGILTLSTSARSGVYISFLGLIDCVPALFSARRQTLHDMFAGTVVLKR